MMEGMEGTIARLGEIRRFIEREAEIAMLRETTDLLAGWLKACDEAIEALKRYPNGYEAERSVRRDAGDD